MLSCAVIRSVGARLAAGVDRTFGALALARSKRSRQKSRAESLGHAERLEALGAIRALYDRPEHFTAPDTFFPAPGAPAVAEQRVRRLADGEVVDLRWESGYAPFADVIADRYLGTRANHTVYARVLRHEGVPRPAIVLVHGYLGGAFAVEERMWPVHWLYERGLDVVLAVLPFHGLRRGGRMRPQFPSSDPRVTIEGFRQAIGDLRALRSYLAARGAPAVGVMGMSLGGYTTALLATVERELAFAVPVIPLASIADFARDGGRLVGTDEEQAVQHVALEDAFRVVSPLARPALLPPERMLILAGEADRITPIAHAERLAGHLGAPLRKFHGGHLLQLGRADALRDVARMLARLGLLAPR